MANDEFISLAKELAGKYSVADNLNMELEKSAVCVSNDKYNYRFFYDFANPPQQDKYINAPLFHWRNKRRYRELKNIVTQKYIETPLALRIHHVVPKDKFTNSLSDILTYECDLAELITGQKINKVFADFSGDFYANCIMSTDGNIKLSMELGFSPDESEPVLLHEIIARTGIASDVAVDTQTQQYPIYVFKGKQKLTYSDIDGELYGLEDTQSDCIRFILWALSDVSRINSLCTDFQHLQNIIKAADCSNNNTAYTEVEG